VDVRLHHLSSSVRSPCNDGVISRADDHVVEQSIDTVRLNGIYITETSCISISTTPLCRDFNQSTGTTVNISRLLSLVCSTRKIN